MCGASAFCADYATYIGDAYPCQVTAIATDARGNTYITGSRAVSALSPTLSLASIFAPQPDPWGGLLFTTVFKGQTDVFVSKLDASGNLTELATLSGKSREQANGIAIDPEGNIWIVGWTDSANFPLHHPLQGTPSAGVTGFLVKLDPDGGILYSTYLGGTMGQSVLNGIAVDSKGDVYVTGSTIASDYPHTPGLPAGAVSGGYVGGLLGQISGAFFAKIASEGDRILYAGTLSTGKTACGSGSTCSTSSIYTSGTAIAVDPAGNAYIAGNTYGSGLPTTPGALRTEGIGAFVAKVNPEGTGLVYSTLIGAANYYPPPVARNSAPGNFVSAIAVDRAGNAFIAGSTSDPAFPATPSAFQTTPSFTRNPNNPFLAPPSDAFIAKLNSTGSAVVWATFLGGTASDQAQTIAIDDAGDVWVSGTTASTDFPSTSGWPNGSEFLVELNPSGAALSYSARFPKNVIASVLAVDALGTVHGGGANGLISAFAPGSAPWQTSGPRMFGIGNAAGGAMAGQFAAGELISIYGLRLGPATPVSAAFNSAGFLPVTLAGAQVTINGIPAPLLYVSDTQINAVAPVELAAGSAAVRVTLNSASSPDFRVMVDTAVPQVFRQVGGAAIVINENGALNSPSNPAKPGSYVTIWATGAGAFQGADGQMATAPQPLYCCEIHLIDIIGSYDNSLIISYEGAAPGTVNGVVQINFQIPSSFSSTVAYSYYYYYLAVRGSYGEPLKYSDYFSVFVSL